MVSATRIEEYSKAIHDYCHPENMRKREAYEQREREEFARMIVTIAEVAAEDKLR